MLEVASLTTGYGRVQVLSQVSIHVEEGERIAVLGSNGSGKSTLLKAIMGSLEPWNGDIRWRGQSLAGVSVANRVRTGMSLVPGDRRLFRGLSVRHNIELGAGWTRGPEMRTRYRDALDIFPEIASFESRLAGDVSGGQQQMCALARALMSRPSLLMVDELSMGLAPVVVSRFAAALDEVSKAGVTIVWVDQKVADALESTDRAYVLVEGEVAIEGDSKALLTDEAFVTRYVGL